ncbi:MAG: molecular chaperone HtpG [Oscillospiraceae bacterium]|nr:molecular chaperone HtpG [Oscillospiraceae bacterium]MBR7085792.1 molecular chaperone HtpG [Oscillospiraceae bacterium]
METKAFQAESKKLLDMMIHSIYTHKEIFLRELISNASDAIDKLYFRSLTDDSVGLNKEDFFIRLDLNKADRTITITDNGIGMTEEELEKNLGTIANSGSLKFKTDNKLGDEQQIIGQFGVGFYSAFMVAKKVSVYSRAFGTEQAHVWQSEGVEGYTISETGDFSDLTKHGTKIVLELMEDADEENYSEFLEDYRIQYLVKRYSDYIRFPIQMEVSHRKLKEGSTDEYDLEVTLETLNSQVPLWRKNRNELTDDDYNNFYQEKFNDYMPPMAHKHVHNEGTITYDALLYIPSKAPFNYYTREYEKGLQLYTNGVLIMEKCADLLPDYYSFVKGLVDSEDLSLNISREMLQHDRQLKLIAKSIEKTIHNELIRMLKNDRENYEKFFDAFGTQIKYGICSDYGMHKDDLSDLLLFYSSRDDKLITLSEYVEKMPEDQKDIYYAAGSSIAQIKALPQTEAVLAKGYEILYFTIPVDEFAVKNMISFKDKTFKSVTAADLDLNTEEEKKALEEKNEENKNLFETMQKALEGKVQKVALSSRLKSYPVCLTSEGDLTLEMEKTLNAMPTDNKVQAKLVLELNPEHPVFAKLSALDNSETIEKYAKLLYNQALLMENMPIENPAEFSSLICELM